MFFWAKCDTLTISGEIPVVLRSHDVVFKPAGSALTDAPAADGRAQTEVTVILYLA